MPRITGNANYPQENGQPIYNTQPYQTSTYVTPSGPAEVHQVHIPYMDPYMAGQQTVIYTQPGMVVGDPRGQQTVIIQQPGVPMWAAPLPPIPGCPSGLEHLMSTDQLLVKQKKEWLEVFSGFETHNKYVVYDKSGLQLYFAVEDSDFCSRQCLGSLRPFDLGIYDGFRRQIMNIHRPYNCQGCLCPCCLQVMEVQAPAGNTIGYIYEDWSFCIPKFRLTDVKQETILRIEGPCCTMSCCGSDVQFQVLTADGANQIGMISKQWKGMAELFTDADTFGVQFPIDLDVNAKATLLGATFLIDFMFFEDSGDNK